MPDGSSQYNARSRADRLDDLHQAERDICALTGKRPRYQVIRDAFRVYLAEILRARADELPSNGRGRPGRDDRMADVHVGPVRDG